MDWTLFFQIFILMGWAGLLISACLNKSEPQKSSNIQRVTK